MSTSGPMQPTTEASPRTLARLAGSCQLLESITAAYGQVIVLGGLTVSGNPAATAGNILSHGRLYWLGFAACAIGVMLHIAYALLYYDLFRPVNRRLSLFALLVLLVATAVQALTAVFYLAPMLVLSAGSSLSAFTTDQLQALAYAFIRLNGYSFNTHLLLFGLWCAVSGVLIARSTFMPRILGVLLVVAGLGWLLFLVPPVAVRVYMPFIAAASAIGEIPVEFWLITMAVDAERWQQQARAAGVVTGQPSLF